MNKSIEIVTDRILALMEQGQIPWAKPWRGDVSAPRNAVSNREYSGINAMLLSMSGYSDNRFLTFKQALESGGNVKKGEKGWPVIYVKMLRFSDKDAKPGEISSADREFPYCKHYTVFNVSQCEGLPEKFTDTGDDETTENPVIPTCAEVVANMPLLPAIVHGSNQACYSRDSDTVKMPDMDRFDSSEGYYDTLFHELAHSTGHQSRVGRFQPGTMNKFGSKEYGKEELIAEITAAALCHETRIFDKIERNTTAYLQSWIATIKADKSALVSAARQAEKAADYILNSDSAKETDSL